MPIVKRFATEDYVETSMSENSQALEEKITAKNQETINALNQVIETKYSADNPPPYPVISVNGETGAIVLNSETWTFTLDDGSTVTKKVVIL